MKRIFQFVSYIRISSEFGQEKNAGVCPVKAAVEFEPKNLFAQASL